MIEIAINNRMKLYEWIEKSGIRYQRNLAESISIDESLINSLLNDNINWTKDICEKLNKFFLTNDFIPINKE